MLKGFRPLGGCATDRALGPSSTLTGKRILSHHRSCRLAAGHDGHPRCARLKDAHGVGSSTHVNICCCAHGPLAQGPQASPALRHRWRRHKLPAHQATRAEMARQAADI